MSLLSTDPAKALVAKPVDALIEFLGSGNGRLLDIGCGEGVLSDTLSQQGYTCLLYTSPSPRDKRQSRMPSSA